MRRMEYITHFFEQIYETHWGVRDFLAYTFLSFCVTYGDINLCDKDKCFGYFRRSVLRDKVPRPTWLSRMHMETLFGLFGPIICGFLNTIISSSKILISGLLI